MMIRTSTFFLLIFFVLSATMAVAQTVAPQWASIKAFLPRWEGATITIVIGNKVHYKGQVQAGMVSFNCRVEGVSLAGMEVKGEKTIHLFFFAEPGVLRITDDGRVLRAFGTPNNDRLSAIENELDSLARTSTVGTLSAVKEMKRQKVADLVMKEPSSPVSLRLLYLYYFDEPSASDTLYYKLFQQLSAELRSSEVGKIIEQEVNSRFKVAIGRQADLLLLPDQRKTMQPVYRKGEFTLIHFWASWCQPCRKFNRSLKDLQDHKFAVPFSMVGISVDNNFSAWTNAIRLENLNWMQLSDLKGWNGDAVSSFSIEHLPSNIVVDPDGRIIARNVSADDLKKILANAGKTF